MNRKLLPYHVQMLRITLREPLLLYLYLTHLFAKFVYFVEMLSSGRTFHQSIRRSLGTFSFWFFAGRLNQLQACCVCENKCKRTKHIWKRNKSRWDSHWPQQGSNSLKCYRRNPDQIILVIASYRFWSRDFANGWFCRWSATHGSIICILKSSLRVIDRWLGVRPRVMTTFETRNVFNQ